MLVPRPQLFNAYWQFAAERQRIFFTRLAGEPAPWTADPILQRYKFCNAYRANDRLSQFLLRKVIYRPGLSQNEEDVVFRILLLRLFNRAETWEFLEQEVGEPCVSTFNPVEYARVLESAGTLFGNAFIFCANKAFGYDRKHENYLALLHHMLQQGIVRKVLAARSFRELYEHLMSFPLVGRFMAYQLATDLNYSELINFDENSFTTAGPGAVRGIHKCFHSIGNYSHEDVIMWMTYNQEQEFSRRGIDPEIVWLWGRQLKAIDCQNLFCEIDKYARVAYPQLKSNRKRIKTTFQPKMQPINYFYPPKWGINNRLVKKAK